MHTDKMKRYAFICVIPWLAVSPADPLSTWIVPLALLIGYVLLIAALALRRGLRGRQAIVFALCLVFAAAWLLTTLPSALLALWPDLPWPRAAPYLLLLLAVFWVDFGRTFLQKPGQPLLGWLPAALVFVAALAVDVGLLTLPPLLLGQEALIALVGASAAALYATAAVVTALLEYVRRPSPLHRNRIIYWLLGTTTVGVGTLLVVFGPPPWPPLGALVHWLGAMLLTYTVVQPFLPNIATGVRQLLSYVLSTLLPAALTVGLGAGAVYMLNDAGLLLLTSTRNLLWAAAFIAVAVFVLYHPTSSLTRRVVNRLLFGRRQQAPRVVREYSQAVTQILSLPALAERAVQTIDGAVGIRQGTLLVVDDARPSGWRLRVLEGLNVPAGQPPLSLSAGSPLADWLVRRGRPLTQYSLDVDPRFESSDPAERAAWRRLDMELFVPVRRSDELVGLLALGVRRSGQPYGSGELTLLETLADQTAIALENAALFDRVQRRAEQLALLNEIGRAITASLELEPQHIARQIESAFKDSAGFVFLLDDNEGDMVLRSSFGRYLADAAALRVRPREGLVGWVAAEGRPALVVDLLDDPRYSPAVEGVLAAETGSALCAPLIAQGRTTGVLLVLSAEPNRFGPAELNLLDSIASFASIAVENARQVLAREEQLRRQVESLRIEIDQIKRHQHVEEITETDYFRQLQAQARRMRDERSEAAEAEPPQKKGGLFDRIQQELDKREDTDEHE